MSLRLAVVCALAATLAGCKRASPTPPSAEATLRAVVVVVVDGGEPASRAWSCVEEPLPVTLPRGVALGVFQSATVDRPAIVGFAFEGDRGRKNGALELGAAPRVVEGPAVDGDAPPWVPLGAGVEGALRFARLALAGGPKVTFAEGEAVRFEAPVATGDELALDAFAPSKNVAIVATSEARGVVVRTLEGGKIARTARIEGAESPSILVDAKGAVAVAARLERAPEAQATTHEVAAAALEGGGEDRAAASLVIVDAKGSTIATHALPPDAQLLGATPSRRAVALVTRRAAKRAGTAVLEVVDATGRRAEIVEVPMRRGARIHPIEVAATGEVEAGACVELTDGAASVAGARSGPLAGLEADALLAASSRDEILEIVFVRGLDAQPVVARARCRWATR